MSDRYTKAILTVIALCLAIIAAENANVSGAVAQQQPQRVVLVDQAGTPIALYYRNSYDQPESSSSYQHRPILATISQH